MKAKCPKCGFEGNVSDNLIPDNGRNINCPKCGESFFIKKEKEVGSDRNIPKTADRPPVISSPRIHVPQKNTPKLPPNVLTGVVIGVSCLAVGFGAAWFLKPDGTSSAPKTEISGSPSTPKSPNSEPIPATRPPESEPTGVDEMPAPVVEPPAPIKQENEYVSDTYVDVSEIDMKASAWYELTDLQRTENLTTYLRSLLGKMLRGYFKVENVDEMGSYYGDAFPRGLYSYLIEADSLTENAEYIALTSVRIGVKTNKELLLKLQKDTRIYVEGYIYNGRIAYMSLDLILVNCKISLQ